MEVLELSSVSLTRNERPLLREVSWRIESGEHWALLGANGSGKTLTLQLILGFLWPTRGQVRVLGNTYGKCDIRKVRPMIGWVNFDMQFRFIERGASVEEAVVSSLYSRFEPPEDEISEEDKRNASEALAKLKMQGYESRVFSSLSFGEQKRVLIARALVHNPRLLILDEPCTGLDIASREGFLADIQGLISSSEDTHVVFVTHHTEEILPYITHALLLKEGQAVKKGPVEQVLTSEVLSEAFEMALKVERSQSGRFLTGFSQESKR